MTILFIKNIKTSLTSELDSNKPSKHFISHNTALELLSKSLEYLNQISVNRLPEIIKNKHGKPIFKNQSFPSFNWSHTNDIVFLGISKKKIGVDVEIEKNRNIESITDRFFSIHEKEYIQKDPINNFFNIWVIREAISKYIGNGLQGFEKITIEPNNKFAIYKIGPEDKDDIDNNMKEKIAYIYTTIINNNYHMAVVTEEEYIETYSWNETTNKYKKTELNWTRFGILRFI